MRHSMSTQFKHEGTKQRSPLHGFHTRKARSNNRSVVTPNATLPPMDAFTEASPELQAKLEEWHTLAAQSLKYAREARKAIDAAEVADRNHRAAVHAAMAAGTDLANIPPSEGKALREQATAHQANYDAARNGRERLGYDLAPLLEAEAASLTPTVDAKLEAHSKKISALLEKVRAEYAEWAQAFQLRVWLSWTDLNGGQVSNYDQATNLPGPVLEALKTLSQHLASTDNLRHDEAEVRAYREQNTR